MIIIRRQPVEKYRNDSYEHVSLPNSREPVQFAWAKTIKKRNTIVGINFSVEKEASAKRKTTVRLGKNLLRISCEERSMYYAKIAFHIV